MLETFVYVARSLCYTHIVEICTKGESDGEKAVIVISDVMQRVINEHMASAYSVSYSLSSGSTVEHPLHVAFLSGDPGH